MSNTPPAAAKPTNAQLDAFLDGPRGDRLRHRPVKRFHQPRVAGHADFAGAFVDALEHVFVDAEEHFLIHNLMLSDLLSASTTDIVLLMTTSEATEALTTAINTRTAAVRIAETLTGRKASAAWRAIEELDAEVGFAARRVEQAERAAA